MDNPESDEAELLAMSGISGRGSATMLKKHSPGWIHG